MKTQLQLDILSWIEKFGEMPVLHLPYVLGWETQEDNIYVNRPKFHLFRLGLVMASLIEEGLIEEVPGKAGFYRIANPTRDAEIAKEA